ncbi:MAG: hypothetical protein FJ271_32320 [Planctomycetes bacterium]|nr:hypothetical protein [Planctomycetota bacterium]
MFLLEPNETPYDLRWRMFGIDIRVHPMFWLVTAIMGSGGNRIELDQVFIWIACVFVSILIHELGHVWMGQVFGSHGHIVLYGFGGLAIGSNNLYRRSERILVCFAGPAAGFLFLALLFLLIWLRDADQFLGYLQLAKLQVGLPPAREHLIHVLQVREFNHVEFTVVWNLIFINLLWGLVNLLPIWPLDGGQISRDVCLAVWPNAGLTRSLGISLVVSGLLALHSISVMANRPLLPFLPFGSTFTAIFFGLFAVQSFQLLQQARTERRWQDDHWHRGGWDR